MGKCDKCIHHTDEGCSSWDCQRETIDDLKLTVRIKAINDLVEAINGKKFQAPNGEAYLVFMGDVRYEAERLILIEEEKRNEH